MRTICETEPELWTSDNRASRREAAEACASCPIKAECYAGALERREFWGVWGGVDFSKGGDRPKYDDCRRGPKPIAHGTPGGYRSHMRQKAPMCDACRSAMQAYRAEKKRAA